MGLKRRNPAHNRLLNASPVLAAKAEPKAPAAKVEPKVEAPAAVTPVEPVEAKVPEAPPVMEAKVIARPLRKVSGDERHQMIARAAYRYAERANFTTDPVQNWLLAEQEIDAQIERLAS